MDTILDNFSSEKLFHSSSLLDLEDLNEADFFNNVHFSENMEDFSNELFNSFFDDPLLAEKNPLLDMELDPPNPDIQAEHSYSLSGDSAPQSPIMSIKMDEEDQDSDASMWCFGHELSAILVKQEPNLLAEPTPTPMAPKEQNPLPLIKAEPREVNQFLNVPSDELVQLPPTPPSSHGSDSDGSQSPHSLPPASPVRPQARTSTAISSSPLLTAPHKLQGTSGPLMLTEEEKRTLVAEGYPVPNKLPLTKTEEKALKRVRRKIKNKISAQESRRKKKEYVECLEKKVETYTSENNELWKKVETLETANRTLLQQLQKLQTLVTGKVPRSCKMASTQTGTCLMVVVLCFVLVLGSFMPSIPEFSSVSQTVESTPLSSSDAYTSSQIRSRSLLFYDEGASLEDRYSSFLAVEHTDDWEASPKDLAEEGEAETRDPPQGHTNRAHEASKYLSKLDVMNFNRTDSEFIHQKEQFHERDVNSDSPTFV
ncbi:cyclic AMP-responsive element-binding protein 3-like protein 1 isoform X2 [Acipenser oxyrinchus oxyrinchus]|uniref:Cyclic AMP-responsive element-binding protein 3-like protein 1 isoform X2 n=1 Tax=Acipenser oxyrinchus oxyrinchus TaxID=40147 RepID=A0AAD8FXH5_ACIOX|nr:cyclic AMP-responsive element-binding protein 3-like protein 1 isoform X2 [Acipenser oxyrinchus oxyrinchus]